MAITTFTGWKNGLPPPSTTRDVAGYGGIELTPDRLLAGYAAGIFPMAERRDDPVIHWVDPQRRGILPLEGFHVSRSLTRRMRQWPHQVSMDRDFDGVVAACAARPETWINAEIAALYSRLFKGGHAHSLEIWDDDLLVGGVYGVVLGAAFFGESMFSRRTDASKLALAYLVHRLRAGGFALFDTQFLTPHLASLGAVEISRAAYHRLLAAAIARKATIAPPGYSFPVSPSSVAAGAGASPGRSQLSTQTS